MAIYEIYSHAILQKYRTSVCSKATVFYFIATILTFIPPLMITYRSQGFWKKVNFYREQPDVHFKHKMMLLLETRTPDKIIVWSSFPKLNQLLRDNIQRAIPSVEHRQEDFNKDGRNDKLLMTIEVPLVDEEILSVKLILFFDYKLHLYSSFQMESIAYFHYSSPLPGASVSVTGELSLHQKEPLRHRGKDFRYNKPVIDESKSDIKVYDLENIFSAYVARNVTTNFRHMYPVWKTVRGHDQPFKITLTVIYPEETIQYRVGFWQLMKWAWVQYISVSVIFWYAFRCIKTYIFQKQLVPTIVYSPLKREI